MANRCYLYACEADPSRHDVAPIGLCEHTNDIALAQLIMVMRGARRVDSLLFANHFAVVADNAGAAERTLAFLAKLGSGKVVERTQFDQALDQMREVVMQTTLDSHLLLEVGEVLDPEDVDELVAGLADLDAQIERAMRGEEEAWLDELRASWQTTVMPWWANSLYYSFGTQAVTWNRGDVDAMLAVHDRAMTKLVGHPFRYRIGPGVAPHQLGTIVEAIADLAQDVENVPDPRLNGCEIGVHERDVQITFREGTLFVRLSTSGWPSHGVKRRVMHALGVLPPPHVEYGRATV
ncbi:MAG TPA: hypothetical protein VFV99_21155 [Kofleriaceae bacterium]|nr:hypothetical protein [Kofleriaceae bacterium]